MASLIATGRPDVGAEQRGLDRGRAGGRAARRAASPARWPRSCIELGFDQVDIQPELLAREGEPGGPLHVRQADRPRRCGSSTRWASTTPRRSTTRPCSASGRAWSCRAKRSGEPTAPSPTAPGSGSASAGRAAPSREAARSSTPGRAQRDRGRGRAAGVARVAAAGRSRSRRARSTYWDLLDDADRMREEAGGGRATSRRWWTPRLDGDVAVFSGERRRPLPLAGRGHDGSRPTSRPRSRARSSRRRRWSAAASGCSRSCGGAATCGRASRPRSVHRGRLAARWSSGSTPGRCSPAELTFPGATLLSPAPS